MSTFEDVRRRALQHETLMLQASRRALDGTGAEMQGYAQANAPWQDDTGAARRGLLFVRRHPPDLKRGRIALIGKEKHNYHLELSHGSRYEIIQSTFALHQHRFAGRLRELWGKKARKRMP